MKGDDPMNAIYVTNLTLRPMLFSCVLSVLGGALAHGYKGPEHTDIGNVARDNYKAYVAANPSTSVGSAAITSNWTDIAWGLVNEDNPPNYTNCVWHFWDPDGGDNQGIWGFDSAYTRATGLWNEAIAQYKTGSYQAAYRNLGAVAHLVGDMGVPAHVNLDDHSDEDAPEWYEGVYIAQGMYSSAKLRSGTSLRDIMVTVAEISDDFDSGPVDGTWGVDGEVDKGNRRKDGFVTAEGVPIGQSCYPAAIEGTAGLFKLWYDTIQPRGSLHSPLQEEVHSGLKGVPLKAMFRSYGYNGQEADQIAKVDFYYATKDDPTWPGDFTACGSAASRDTKWYFAVDWRNTLNDDKVWVNCVATDNGGCESLTSAASTLEWFSIDSTRPVVKNAKP